MYPQSLQMYACILHRVCNALERETRAARARIVVAMPIRPSKGDLKGRGFGSSFPFEWVQKASNLPFDRGRFRMGRLGARFAPSTRKGIS